MKTLAFTLLSSILLSCSSAPNPEEKKAKLYYNQGTQELVNKNYTKALNHLMASYKLNPESSKTNNNLGMAYFFKGNEQIAIKHINKAIELDNENTDAVNNLATIYMNLNKLEKAEKLYKKINKNLFYEKQQLIYHNLGLIKIKQGKIQQAIAYFNEAIKQDEFYCPSHYKIGELAFQAGRYETALKKFKESNQGFCYKQPEPQYFEAASLIELKRYDSARVRLENLMERFPEHKYSNLAKRKLLFLDQVAPTSSTQYKRSNANKFDGQNFSPNL
jgi:type IV pilus assembly protein PilF